MCQSASRLPSANTTWRVVSLPAMPFQCSICSRSFLNEYNHAKHEARATCQAMGGGAKSGKLKCSHCSAYFAREFSLRRHEERYHSMSAASTHACGFCPQRFSLLDDMVRHRRQHHERDLNNPEAFMLRDSAHSRQSQSWRLVFPTFVDTLDRAFFYAW